MSVNHSQALEAVFVNAEDGARLFSVIADYAADTKTGVGLKVRVAMRPVGGLDPASFVIWAVGVFTCIFGCYLRSVMY